MQAVGYSSNTQIHDYLKIVDVNDISKILTLYL